MSSRLNKIDGIKRMEEMEGYFFDNYKFIYTFNINAKMHFWMQGIPA
jgi:hypothetical protein